MHICIRMKMCYRLYFGSFVSDPQRLAHAIKSDGRTTKSPHSYDVHSKITNSNARYRQYVNVHMQLFHGILNRRIPVQNSHGTMQLYIECFCYRFIGDY